MKKSYHVLNSILWPLHWLGRYITARLSIFIRLYSIRNSLNFYEIVDLALKLRPSISKKGSLYF